MADDTRHEMEFDRDDPEVPAKVRALTREEDLFQQEHRSIEYLADDTAFWGALFLAVLSLAAWLIDTMDGAGWAFGIFAAATAITGHFRQRMKRMRSRSIDNLMQMRAMGWSYATFTGTLRYEPEKATPGRAVPPRVNEDA